MTKTISKFSIQKCESLSILNFKVLYIIELLMNWNDNSVREIEASSIEFFVERINASVIGLHMHHIEAIKNFYSV